MHGVVQVSVLVPSAQLSAFCSLLVLIPAPSGPGQSLHSCYQQKRFSNPQVSTFDRNISLLLQTLPKASQKAQRCWANKISK